MACLTTLNQSLDTDRLTLKRIAGTWRDIMSRQRWRKWAGRQARCTETVSPKQCLKDVTYMCFIEFLCNRKCVSHCNHQSRSNYCKLFKISIQINSTIYSCNTVLSWVQSIHYIWFIQCSYLFYCNWPYPDILNQHHNDPHESHKKHYF